MKSVNSASEADKTFAPRDPHPMGRRAWRRVAVNHVVTLHPVTPHAGSLHAVTLYGGGRSMKALAVDLSRGGILVAVDDRSLADDAAAGSDDGLQARVDARFPDGVEVRFDEIDIARKATIARVLLSPCANIGIGCAFDEALTTREALQLGIVTGEVSVPEVRLDTLPFEPRPGTGLSLLLEDGSGDLVGPFALGPVMGAGEVSVDAVFPQDVSSLVESCGDKGFHAALVVGMERLWEGPAQLVICEPAENRGSWARVLFETSFDRRLARHLRRKIG